MAELILNNELLLKYPEGFHVMSEEERSKMNMLEEGKWAGLFDPDKHILVTVGWKQTGIASMILSGLDLANNMEKHIRRAMMSFGYRLEGFKECQIADTKVHGFGYEYVSHEIPMYAESYAMKKGKVIYYFHFYARTAMKSESIAIWRDMLSSIAVK